MRIQPAGVYPAARGGPFPNSDQKPSLALGYIPPEALLSIFPWNPSPDVLSVACPFRGLPFPDPSLHPVRLSISQFQSLTSGTKTRSTVGTTPQWFNTTPLSLETNGRPDP